MFLGIISFCKKGVTEKYYNIEQKMKLPLKRLQIFFHISTIFIHCLLNQNITDNEICFLQIYFS